MKRFFLALMLCCAAVSLTAAPLPKKISVGKKSIMQLKPGNFVIVIPAKAIPVVKFAASELQKFLSQSMDSKIPVVTVPESGKINIHVGMTAEAKKAGIDLSKLVRDGFYIRTSGKNIFIAGIDDPKKNPVHEIKTGGGWSILYEHATIFGVYDFLERFAGMRFYFEGELGTIVPKNKVLNIPEINIVERPDFTVRSYSAFYDGEYFEGPKPKATINPKKNINLYRNRFHTMSMPCCHGIQGFGMLHRFGESNPEYFALASNGRRLNDPNVRFPGQLCWSSNVREEIYKDVEAYLKGRPAKERGVVWKKKGKYTWAFPYFRYPYVDVMPQDNFHRCYCKNCTALYNPGKYYATELIWGNVIEWGNRLKKAGIKGQINMMAYPPYRGIPKKDIPDNINVMVAETGAWQLDPAKIKEQDGEVIAWYKKLGRKVWLWNYSNKFGRLNIKGVPAPTPRAIGAYYTRISPYAFGAFMESECDRFLYFYLNFYIFSKVTWNNKADYNAMIDEHHKLMFGKAYPVMKKVFDRFEHIWLKQIYGRTEDTPLGPVVAIPSDHDLWHKVYSPKVIAEITADFNKAAAMVEKGSLEAKRIALFRREYLDNLAQAARDYLARTSAVKGVQMRLDGTPIHLIPLVTRKKDNSIMVDTAVSARMNDKTLDFTFVCEEPLAGQNVAVERKHDDKGMWRDDSVEIFLNPSGDKKTYYQLIINSKGCITDYKWFKAGQSAKADKSWSSGAKVNIAPVKGGFKVTVSIPLKSLPGLKKTGFPVNFGRSRILASQGKNHIHYKWSRYAKGFHDLENFGMLVPCKKEIVNDPGFDIVRQSRKDSRFWNDPRDKKARSWYSSKLKADDYAALDNKEYFSAPCSMKLVSTSIKGRSIGQYITGKLKPNTTYRVSFKIKMQNVVKMRNSASGVCLNIWDDANRWFPKGRWLTGTMDWTYMSFLHKTSAKVDKAKNSYVHLRMMGCTGTVWVDDISIEEVE